MRPPVFLKRMFPNVTTCIDAKKGAVIDVRPTDCAAGKKMQAAECALAKAAKRQYHADGALIGIKMSYIVTGEKATRFQTTEAVAREIVSFDRHSDFAPGKYLLSQVSPSKRMGKKTKRTPHKSGKTRSRIVHKRTVRIREQA